MPKTIIIQEPKEQRKIGLDGWRPLEIALSADDYDRYMSLPYSKKDFIARSLDRVIKGLKQTDIDFVATPDRPYRIYTRISPIALARWRKLPRRGRSLWLYSNIFRDVLAEVEQTELALVS